MTKQELIKLLDQLPDSAIIYILPEGEEMTKPITSSDIAEDGEPDFADCLILHI